MKILITGVSGMLGYDLYNELSKENDVYGCSRTAPPYIPSKKYIKIDLTDFEATYNSVTKLNPDVVIHCAAYTDVDGCERQVDMAYLLNTIATRNVAVACQRFDTIMVYISTDYVFDGNNMPDGGYTEFDRPNPINIYGKTKLEGEIYVKHLLEKFFIIRTAWLFGKNRTNFVSNVIEKIKNNQEIKVVSKQQGSLTYTVDLSKAISNLIKTNKFGIYHITNSMPATRIEVVNHIAKILNIEPKIKIVEMEEVYFAKRPQASTLNNYMLKLQKMPILRDWKSSLIEFIGGV